MFIVRTTLVFGLLLATSSDRLAAQSVTAFKTGEETTGMTKQCFYSFGGTKYTKTIKAVQLCPLGISAAPITSQGQRNDPRPQNRPSITAFKSGEETTGMTKQCYYTFGINKYTKTIQAVQLCPLSITVATP